MAEVEAMDVDEKIYHNYGVWFFPGTATTRGRLHLRQVDYKSLTLDRLKQLIIEENTNRSAGQAETMLRSIEDFDLLYNGNLLKNTAENTLTLKPEAIVYVVKRSPASTEKEPEPSASALSASMIRDLSMSLRDAFLRTNFIKVLEKLAEPNNLQKVFAAAPGLEKDLMGIAIIQTPQLMFQISDRELLQKVAITRPWLIEALKHIVATVQAERVSKPGRISGALASEFLNTTFMDGGEEDDDDDMDDDAGEPQRTQSQPNMHGPITREQLAQALSALPNIAGIPSSSTNPFAGLMNPLNAPGPSRPTTAPIPATDSSQILNPTFQQLLQNAFNAMTSSAGSTGNLAASPQSPLTGLGSNPAAPVGAATAETFTRALQMAMSHLTPDDRANQFERVRQMAQQVVAGNPLPPATEQPPAATGSATTPAASTTPASEPRQWPPRDFSRELAQLREMGINDERLSIMALRVSDGDVETAVDLILSGWDGAGAEEP